MRPTIRSPEEREAIDEAIPIDLHRVLDMWASWHKRDHLCIGYSNHSAGFAVKGRVSSFEDMEDGATEQAAPIVERLIDELEDYRHKMSIYNRYIHDVATFRGDPVELMREACLILWRACRVEGLL